MFAIKIIFKCHFPTDELEHTNVKRSRLFCATNILYEEFSKIVKCLIIAPSLNKQQCESEISEISMTQKSSM